MLTSRTDLTEDRSFSGHSIADIEIGASSVGEYIDHNADDEMSLDRYERLLKWWNLFGEPSQDARLRVFRSTNINDLTYGYAAVCLKCGKEHHPWNLTNYQHGLCEHCYLSGMSLENRHALWDEIRWRKNERSSRTKYDLFNSK